MTNRRQYRFHSCFAEELASHVAVNQALGRKYVSATQVLRQFDRFVAQQFPNAEEISLPIIEAWMADNPKLLVSSRLTRLKVLRQFCLYRRHEHPDAYVPGRKTAWSVWPSRVPRRRPYIFTTNEVKQLLDAAQDLRSITNNTHRPQTFFNILLLLYATGMRVSEAIALKIGDVDWAKGTLLIRESKFFKTRLVPVCSEMMLRLKNYCSRLGLDAGSSAFRLPLFQRARKRSYSITYIEAVVTGLLRVCGLKSALGCEGPRVHDLRHTFAVHRISRWYREGANVQNLLPKLATYMGHKDIASTQYYLTVTDEILQMAGQRFGAACAPGKRR